ncbi:MAG: hypothetical protein IH862_03575 [Chloroflexi bacterium]|nr:hypothetical protein [Chloroflexota bacterium]
MARKKQLTKTPEQRLRECETHLYFLWDERRLYQTEPDRYKNIASHLRILVAEHKPARSLLMAMMQHYGFAYEVQPPGPPLHPFERAIPMVGWRDDPIQIALAKKTEAALGDPQKLATVLEREAALRRPVPFPEYVEKGLAMYIAPHDYSFRDLVLAVAQQIGTSHEAPSVDEPIVQAQTVIIGGHESHIAALIVFADTVIHVGKKFLEHVIENHGYRLRHFKQTEAPGE